MKRKKKVRRSPDVPPPDNGETAVELAGPPPTPGRSSMERVDEGKGGSIESTAHTSPANGVAGFIEPDGSGADGAGPQRVLPER